MADQSSDNEARAKIREFYRIAGNVVGELRSQEIRDTYAAITIEEVLGQQLEFLVDGSPTRVSRKKRLTDMYEEFKKNLDAIKATPPSAFRQADPKNDAVTPP